MALIEELKKLGELHLSGVLNDEEFEQAKKVLLVEDERAAQAGPPPPPTPPPPAPAPEPAKSLSKPFCDVPFWCMCIHLSQFAAYIVPMAGIVVPIVLWQIKKDESEEIDRHGKVVVNWLITAYIYAFVFGLLSMVVIGIPFLVILGILGVVYPIVGALKANDGTLWPYPGSFHFLSIEPEI